MFGKKTLALVVAPFLALGMTACQVDTEDEPDIYIEEGQLPAYEDPTYDMQQDGQVERDTTIVFPDEPVEPEDDVTTDDDPTTQY